MSAAQGRPAAPDARRSVTAWAPFVLFFFSGAAALIVEITWLRWFRLLLGATAPAASATLIAFFSGHAIGAALAARLAPRWRRPLRAYGLLELAAAAAALITPLVLALGTAWLPAIYDDLRQNAGALSLVRFSLAMAATLPSAVCFGASFPALGAAVIDDTRALGATGSRLYALNTLGAALGVALAAFFLPDWIGVGATYACALVLLAAVGGAALVLARFGVEARETGPAPDPQRDAPDRRLLAIAALSGFGSFAAQVLFVQALGQVLNQSVYAFGAVLVTVLIGLALGAEGIARLARRGRPDPRTLLGAALAASAIALASFPALLERATDGLRFVGSGRPWPAYAFEAIFTSAVTVGPAVLIAGLVFPLTFALAARRHDSGRGAGAPLGRLVAANTVGAIAGALAAPYLLLPAAGIFGAFAWVAALYALPALCVRDVSARRHALRAAALGAAALGVLLGANPLQRSPVTPAAGESALAVFTSASGVVSVIERDGERLIRTDNHYALGGTGQRVHQERQAHLPLLLHPTPERVAYVGSATGISAGAVLVHPIEKLHVVELVPDVARAARAYFRQANRGVYDDPRTEVVLDDARNFMRLTASRFDVVVSDLFVPWRSGTGALYARETFASVRDHLRPNGIFCQWLPLYQLSRPEFASIAATFRDVFPRSALFRGDFYGRFPIIALVGFTGSPAQLDRVATAARALGARGVEDRWVTDPAGVPALYVGPLAAFADELSNTPLNTDDRPRIQYLAARTHLGGQRGKSGAFVGLDWTRFAARASEAALRGDDDVLPSFSMAGGRSVAGGAALQLAGAHWAVGQRDAAARALEVAAELLPEHLLRNAPEDPSAADLWPDE